MNLTNKTLIAVALMLGGLISAEVMNVSVIESARAAGDCGCAQAAPVDASHCGCGCSEAPAEIACDACVEEEACCESRGCAARGCRAKGCRTKKCREPRCRKVACPSCAVECDTCTLELDKYEEEKTCFKTEQKIVCIPPVRFPWDKCCPPGKSKTRTVNVLKVHKYKCKACGYKWKLDEMPEPTEPSAEDAAEQAAPAEQTAPPTVDPTIAPVENGVLLPPESVQQPAFESTGLPDATEIPAAPTADAVPNPPALP